MSRPIEAFALLNFLDKERFNNFFHFTQRYGGWKGEAPRNLQDLHDRTKDLVIRRKKEQILTELPAKQRNDLYVELTKDEQKQYKELLREVFGRWKVEKPTIGHMPKLQNFLIEKKIPRLVEMVDEFLDNDKPILIFSNYIAPLKFLAEQYGDKAALLTGEMNSKERQVTIDRLTKGEAKVGLFSILLRFWINSLRKAKSCFFCLSVSGAISNRVGLRFLRDISNSKYTCNLADCSAAVNNAPVKIFL